MRYLTSIFLVLLVVCQPTKSFADSKTAKIGVLLCFSGDCVEWGTNALRGVQLAAEKLNRRGGVLGRKVKLVVQDSTDAALTSSVPALRTLVSDQEISFIVGPSLAVGGGSIASLVARMQDLNMISPSVGDRQFNESAGNIFSVWPHDELAPRALAQYAIRHGWRRAAIFGGQEPSSVIQAKMFSQEFVRLGGMVVLKVTPLLRSRDLQAEVSKIKSAKPDFVLLLSNQADLVATEFGTGGYSPPIVALQMEKARVLAAHGALEGSVFPMLDRPKAEFVQSFIEKFGEFPGPSADTAYDAMMLYATAVQNVQSFDAVKVRAALHAIKDYQGASGTFSMDEKGAVDKKPVLWRFKGGEYERVE